MNYKQRSIILKIEKEKIVEPKRYLLEFSPDEQLFVAVPLCAEDYEKLGTYGILADDLQRIPRPIRAATSKNANGYTVPVKDLPKEIRSWEHSYRYEDWGGTEHYGTCWQDRKCYQRRLIPPTEVHFHIDNSVLFSTPLVNREEDYPAIKAAINVALEMLGRCELWPNKEAPIFSAAKDIEVPWEILRAGTRNSELAERYLTHVLKHKSEGEQTIIRGRHKHLNAMNPDFRAVGKQGYWGYIIYGFQAKNLYVFESGTPNNATYFFVGGWETASRLTKTEILTGHLHELRIFHSRTWHENVAAAIRVYLAAA